MTRASVISSGPRMTSLMNVYRRCADLFDGADDQQVIAEAGRPFVADVDLDHGISAAARPKLGGLVHADRADKSERRAP